MKASKRFFWAAHPARALAEAWLLGLAILGVLAWQVGSASPYVLSNGLLFLCGACGIWCVLRTRLPQGSGARQIAWELGAGAALSAVMAVGMRLPARVLGWESMWQRSSLGGGNWFITFLFLATGAGYLLARGGVRVWLFWDRLRRRRMLWALTHAQLVVVVLLACLGALGLLALASYPGAGAGAQPSLQSWLLSASESLFHTLIPGLSIVVAMTALALLVLLPPAAIFSYLVAHKTTHRLETLAEAAKALRAGEYDTRVAVAGEDEVAELQAGFNAMAGDLQRTMRDLESQRDTVARLLQSRQDLVANVSHELRTPVATVRVTLESAMEERAEALQPALRHDLEAAHDEVLRLQGLIDDLFTLARTEAGGLSLECRPVEVGPIVEQMVKALAPLAWKAGRVEVVAQVPAGLPEARADKARLQQILANLLRNGIAHTPPGGIVAVTAAAVAEWMAVEVRDTGEGIAAQDLEHIWERFYRGEQDRGNEDGAGLGLAVVKELAEAMGGSASVVSTAGEGSCFTVRLPLA